MARRRLWTKEEDASLRELFPICKTQDVAEALGRPYSSVVHRAIVLGLHKCEAFLRSFPSGRMQAGVDDGRGGATRFKPGHQPWNTGTKGVCGHHPNTRRTQFAKGVLQGRAAQRMQPIGAERITKDGILQRKVNNDLPLQQRWRSVHSLVWEEAHGPIPSGHKVVFRPGQHTSVAEEITPDKLELVSHAELMRRNSYHNRYPKEVGLLIQMQGQLTRRIHRREEVLREEQG